VCLYRDIGTGAAGFAMAQAGDDRHCAKTESPDREFSAAEGPGPVTRHRCTGGSDLAAWWRRAQQAKTRPTKEVAAFKRAAG